jgi:2-polyprenyl-3-methyl-5-hydroxy-6-metoxy-1,4-benzoquinol methylase
MKKNRIKSYYNLRYISKAFGRPAEFYKSILNYLDPQEGKKLLDIGCGVGDLLKCAEQKGLVTYGIDISEEAITLAKKMAKLSVLEAGEAENLPYSLSFFDYITCIGTLEHLFDIEQGIREMKRVAKDSAKFCIVVPNSNFLVWKFKKYKGTEQPQEKLLSMKEWESILTQNGFKIIDIKKDRGPLTSSNKLKNFIFRILTRCLSLNQTYQIIFICKKT